MCQGAWVGVIHAALRPETVASFTDAAGPIDFCAGGGKLQNICQALPMSFYENMVAAGGGIQKGEFQLYGFKSMNPYERYVGDYVDLWTAVCEGDENKIQKWHRFKDWYDQPIDLPGAWYLEAVEKLFKKNLLITGELEVLGQKVNLGNITCPVFLIAGDKDDITLPEQVFAMTDYVSGPSTKKVLEDAGHIGVFTRSNSLNYWEETILKKLGALDGAELVSERT
jgi:poly(3-hydroxybutyrate) depolymerase